MDYLPDFPSDRDVADVLERAALHLDVHGWRQGDDAAVEGDRCALLALYAVASTADAYTAREELGLFLDVDCIVEWNDEDGRTAAEVTGAMRACAASLRARELVAA